MIYYQILKIRFYNLFLLKVDDTTGIVNNNIELVLDRGANLDKINMDQYENKTLGKKIKKDAKTLKIGLITKLYISSKNTSERGDDNVFD
jgi:hypothetical protein